MAHHEPPHQDLCCLQIQLFPPLVLKELRSFITANGLQTFFASDCKLHVLNTVKILKIGTPEIITIIVLQLEQLDFTVQYCVQKMQTE